MSDVQGHDVPVATFEHRLDAHDLAALARLVGLAPRQIAADHLDVRLTGGVIGARSLAVPLSGRQHEFVNVTSDWIQLPHDDIHLLRAAVTEAPTDIRVSDVKAHGGREVGPCSWLDCKDFGPISDVEIVSYEIEDDLLDAQGVAMGREAVLYDRALRLRFASGRVLTLSSHHNSILGEIEIRMDEGIGLTEPHGVVRTRHILN